MLVRQSNGGAAAQASGNAHKFTSEDRTNGGGGSGVDMSAKHRALPETQQKFKDAGLDPAIASKHALSGKKSGGALKSDTHKSNNSQSQPTTYGKKGCNGVHSEGIRDKKNFANAADA
jgi:hypothetical protein